MFDRIKALYLGGQLDDSGLAKAVAKKWITVEQAEEIKSGKVWEE